MIHLREVMAAMSFGSFTTESIRSRKYRIGDKLAPRLTSHVGSNLTEYLLFGGLERGLIIYCGLEVQFEGVPFQSYYFQCHIIA